MQLPTETVDLLAQYHQEAPEGVPYILLTAERYQRVLESWHEHRKEGKTWQNRFMVNNVLRDFKVHAKRAELQFNGKFTIHTFRKSCAQNWADCLPANVVKFYLGHSTVETTNKFYSVVDESHMTWTKKAMDEMLGKGKTENHLDTRRTLARENSKKARTEEIESSKPSSASPSITSTSDTAGESG